MADLDEAQLYQDLEGFLKSSRIDVRAEATKAVLGLVQSDDDDGDANLVQLTKHISNIVELLARNCAFSPSSIDDHDVDDEESRRNNRYHSLVSIHALQALVHMTSHSNGPGAALCLENLRQESGMNRMIEILLTSPPVSMQSLQINTERSDHDEETLLTADSRVSNRNRNDCQRRSESDSCSWWRLRINLALAIVANMTRVEAGAMDLVGRSLPDEAIFSKGDGSTGRLPPKPTIELLTARFLNPLYIIQQQTHHHHHHKSLANNYQRHVINNCERNESKNSLIVSANEEEEERIADPFQHFAAVLMNATQTESGRLFVLKIHRNVADKDGLGRTVLQALLPELRSVNPVRRRGVAGTIRNCCLDSDFTWWLLNVVHISTHVLYLLAGPEELDLEEKQGLHTDLWMAGPDKRREEDALTRLYLTEAILFLANAGRVAIDTLRKERVDVILKWAEMVEDNEQVSEQMNTCIQLLQENKCNESDDEVDFDCGIDVQNTTTTTVYHPGALIDGKEMEAYDNVD